MSHELALYNKEGKLPEAAPEARPLAENPAAVYLASLGPGSRRTMRQALDTMAELLSGGRITDALLLDWSRLRYPHAAALRAALTERYAPATVNKMLSALRGTLKAAWRLGQISAEERERASDVSPARGERLPRGRSLAPGEIRALVEDCLTDAAAPASAAKAAPAPRPALAARDAALLALLYGCGLRRAEIAALDLSDLREGSEGGLSLVVRGKRNKERLVPVGAGGAEAALRDWLAARGGEDGPLFVPFRKGDRPQRGQRMTTQAVYHVCRERQARAGVAPFSPHDFRRTFVGDLLDRGADIVTVQKLAGHASVTTTARYDRRGERAKRTAADLLHVPYPARPQ